MIINRTQKFKTVVLSIRFKETLKKENVGFRSLLPSVMSSATPLYDTRKKLNEALINLYGSSLTTRTYKIGKLSIVEFRLNILNPSLMEEGFFHLGLKILHNIIYGHKNLPKKYFELEKRLLLERIASLENNKTALALTKLFEIMFKDERYAIRPVGKIKDVKDITYEELNEYYHEVINNNDCDILISGDIDEELKKEVKKYFKSKNNYNYYPIDDELHEKSKLKVINDEADVNQVKLNIGYNLDVKYDDPLETAAVLFNIIFGASSSSRLFKTVREKHSLCYYISSNISLYKGFLYVYAGIDTKQIKLAKKLIEEELNDLKTNLILEEELNLAKKLLISNLKEAEDSQNRWIDVIYQRRLLNRNSSLESKIEKIKKITNKEILNVANKVEIETIYLMNPEDSDGI